MLDTEDMNLPGDDDLGFVRRQLDDLSLARAMGMTSPEDELRYQELCHQEMVLLRQAPNWSVIVGRA